MHCTLQSHRAFTIADKPPWELLQQTLYLLALLYSLLTPYCLVDATQTPTKRSVQHPSLVFMRIARLGIAWMGATKRSEVGLLLVVVGDGALGAWSDAAMKLWEQRTVLAFVGGVHRIRWVTRGVTLLGGPGDEGLHSQEAA